MARPINKNIFEDRLAECMPEPNSGCLIWMGNSNKNGYGLISINRKQFLAHRISYMKANGFIIDEFSVRHKCDNPSCVNPDHLILGTHAENMNDMAKRGRAKGTKGKTYHKKPEKLTDEQVEYIRKTEHLFSTTEIAKRFGVSRGFVSMLRTGKRRKFSKNEKSA